jgi:3-oxoacyl-[acyl-carrier-protein] synthase III
MKIAGINCILPSQKIDNREIIELVSYFSNGLFDGNIKDLRSLITRNLENSGIESRYWRGNKERPLDLISESFNQNLRSSGISLRDIDTIIYVGVDRGFIEPANASFIANKIGLPKVRAFDIVDACMGWCTATQLAQALLKNGDAKTVLIVSSECPMDKNGIIFPSNFKVRNIQELEWKFPAYTIGEAVSTTILQESSNDWTYIFESDATKADLCTIPLYKHQEYSDSSQKLESKFQFNFSAYGRELYFAGYKKSLEVLKAKINSARQQPKLILPHSVSLRVPKRVNEILGLNCKMFTTFSKIGNVATSSIPAHIYFALIANKIKKDDYLIGWIASGGLKYSAFDIYL